MAYASNGRDSNPKYLGLKVYSLEKVKPGQIILKQRGTKFLAGINTYLGKDFTIHSKVEGKVRFRNISKNKKIVEVIY